MKTGKIWRQLGIFSAVIILLAGTLLIGNFIVFKSWTPAIDLIAVIALMGTYFATLSLCFSLIISRTSWLYVVSGISLFLLMLFTLFPATKWAIYTFFPLLSIELYNPEVPYYEEVFRSRMFRNFIFLTIVAAFTGYLNHRSAFIRYLRKEMEYLRQQFSNAHLYPHFVESITATAIGRSFLKSTKGTQEALLHLSDVMRYVLNAQAEPQKLVGIEEELDRVRNLVNIARWKYGDQVITCVLPTQETKTIKTVPFGMLTLVENAIKYTSFKGKHTIHLSIKVEVDQNCFRFICINQVQKSNKVKKGSGFGLKNLRERIAMSGLPIRLTVEETEDRFIASWEQDLY